MSVENALAFVEKVKDDQELLKKVLAALLDDIEASIEAGIAIARDSGYDFSREDWQSCMEQLRQDAEDNSELQDSNLEKVAGGFQNKKPLHPWPK